MKDEFQEYNKLCIWECSVCGKTYESESISLDCCAEEKDPKAA